MMDYASNMLVMVTMVIAAVSMLSLATAKTIVVGGAIGWEIPPTPTTYSDWASNQTFMVNDVLEFDFLTGGHTVAEVTKAAYDVCDTSAIIKLHTIAPGQITLAKAGQVFFFCSVPGHCDVGQKLAVNVTDGRSSLPPAPSPAPRTTTELAATTPTGSSSELLPGPTVHLLIIVATGLMLIFI